jgi:hypothetical protein
MGPADHELLEAELVRDVGERLFHLRGGSLVDLVQQLGVEHVLVQCREEPVFEALARDEHFVLARSAGGVEAAVVATAVPAHEADRAAAGAALEAAREQMVRV